MYVQIDPKFIDASLGKDPLVLRMIKVCHYKRRKKGKLSRNKKKK